ncbi:MAG: SDR family oxidoreductase [Actinobacteria bacterium]|nr:SDR family oxidoreductase [Actinomycetota bacterium]
MDLGLTGKRAIVAAASSGLGYAIAEGLAREGCRVAICSRDTGRVKDAAEALRAETGAEVIGSAVDVSDEEAIKTWVTDVSERWGGIDILIPNAGGPTYGAFDDLSSEQWDEAYHLTLKSAIVFASSARPHLERGSAVLFLTSMTARQPVGPLVLSGVYRAGVAMLAKTLADEWASDGIRVNHLIPGRIATERVAHLDAYAADARGISVDEVVAGSSKAIPLGRYGTPGEFASAAVFLVSQAAAYITGATLQVDGGALRGA